VQIKTKLVGKSDLQDGSGSPCGWVIGLNFISVLMREPLKDVLTAGDLMACAGWAGIYVKFTAYDPLKVE
jgi:hypothetical protein